MKRTNVLLEILKLLGIFIVGCFLWLIIFSTFMPADETGATTEPFPGAIPVLAVVTAVITVTIIKYNTMQNAFQKTRAAYSNISVLGERASRLLDKANRVADKYMEHEESIQVSVADKRTQKVKTIRNSTQFQKQIESYPDLKANENIMELLSQIRDAENTYAQSKLNYNTSAEYYNTMIHVFPNNILRKLFKFKDVEFYTNEEENEISDEELEI